MKNVDNLFRKKPIMVSAVRFDGEYEGAVRDFIGNHPHSYDGDGILIDTLEGRMRANPGDWIIRGIKGELYPCKPDIFVATYESVDS